LFSTAELGLTLSCEFNLADQNWSEEWTQISIQNEAGTVIPSQTEKESSNISLDWRKRVIFEATLQPGRINRFDAKPYRIPSRPVLAALPDGTDFSFASEHVSVVVSRQTGLLETLVLGGKRFDVGGFLRPEVFADDADPWGSNVKGFDQLKGCFTLLSTTQTAELCSVGETNISPVRVIEEGEVRTVVEAYFGYQDSRLIMTYCLPKNSDLIEVQIRVYWHEKDSLLSLGLPLSEEPKSYYGQSMNGRALLDASGKIESVVQQWVGVEYPTSGGYLGIINDGTYSVGCEPDKLNLRLLRSPAYAAYATPGRKLLTKGHFHPRIDQGERSFRFWLLGSQRSEPIDQLDALAQALNQAPSVLSFFPSGAGEAPVAAPMLDNSSILLQAFKKAENEDGYIIRLYNSADTAQNVHLTSGEGGLIAHLEFKRFEIKTLRWSPSSNQYVLCNALEEAEL
jgi:alpha-mannosidase